MDTFWKGYYINSCPRDTPWQKQSQVLEIGCKFDSELNHKRQRRDKFSYKSHNSQRLKNKTCLLSLQHEKVLPQSSIETLCGIGNRLVWLHIKSNQKHRKHKGSCQMSKAMWLGMQVPRGLVWWKLHQLPIRRQTHRKKKSRKNSEANDHVHRPWTNVSFTLLTSRT